MARKRPVGRIPLGLRHPRRVLIGAAIVVLGLGAYGLTVEDKLEPTSLRVPGTESARATDLLREHFGDSAPFAILLRGPSDEIDRQGPNLVVALREDPDVTTISPWDRGNGIERLRPSHDQALILVDFHKPVDDAVTNTVPRLNAILDEEIEPPVVATQSGFATISRAIQDQSIDATRRGELIAIPILLIVLLLVFRSPVAAAIPLAFGVVTVFSSRGLLAVLTNVIDIDGFALAVSSMMGLALGVDYALLMVSRFREEIGAGADPRAAALTTRHTAGRTTIFAGSTLLIAMLISVFMLPGALLASLAGTVVLVTAVAVVSSAFVGPALLATIGPNIDRWRIERPHRTGMAARPAWLLAVDGAMRHPRLVGSVIALGLLALAAPALALQTGPPSTDQLPRDDPARQDAELISEEIGPGWSAPFILVAEAKDGTITQTERLAALAATQKRIAGEPGVEAVIGPGPVARRVEPLREFGQGLLGDEDDDTPIGRMFADLRRARGGIDRLRGGIAQAARGSELLGGGAGSAEAGAAAIAEGLAQAGAAGAQAEVALERFAKGTKQLHDAMTKAVLGALQLKFGTRDLGRNVKANPIPRAQRLDKGLTQDSTDMPQLEAPAQAAEDELELAWAELQGMTIGTGDPNYPATVDAVREALGAVSGTDPVTNAPYAAGYDGLPVELDALASRMRAYAIDADEILHWLNTIDDGLKRLGNASARLYEGLQQIKRATKQLAGGAQQLSDEAGGLSSGLGELDGGAGQLAEGLATLRGGIETLERELVRGYWRSRPLMSGVRRATVRIRSNRQRLRNQSPGLFDSGYFVLSALDGAEGEQRDQAGQVVDIDGGGQAALILTIPESGFNSAGATKVGAELADASERLADDADVETAVAGGAVQLDDYDRVTTRRIPLVVAAITLVTFLAMIVILRALPLAAIAVGLNLVTVAAAFGVICALFAVPEGLPFGGTDFIDAIGAAAIFGVVFGLSIDYAVFLLMRMREHWEATGDNDASIQYGLERTAGVITGAAAIMAAVFLAYAIAPIDTVAQFGIGLTVAVILDATVIRLILLPLLMRAIGDRVWWLPRPLERIVPRLNVEGSAKS